MYKYQRIHTYAFFFDNYKFTNLYYKNKFGERWRIEQVLFSQVFIKLNNKLGGNYEKNKNYTDYVIGFCFSYNNVY